MKVKTLYRFVRVFVLSALVLSSSAVTRAGTSAGAAQAASTMIFNPFADAYVTQSTPNGNYGGKTSLRVDNSPVTRSYLRFVVEGLNGEAIQGARLRIYANSSNSAGYSVYEVPDPGWTESGITFNNSPAAGSLLNSSGSFDGGVWTEVDLSSYIQGEGTYDLVIATTSNTNTNLASRETSGKEPQLVVARISQETLTPTAYPTSTTMPTLVPTDPPTFTSVPTLSPTNFPTATGVPSQTATVQGGADWQPSFPIRAAFYYPWFPQAWTQSGIYPYTNFNPILGFYDSTDSNTIQTHIGMMQYANIQAGIASWWGQGHHTDTKFAGLLSAAAGSHFRWALYYENESQADPSVSQIQSDLTYIRDHYGNAPGFLRVNGKFVVFVYAADNDNCAMADRWGQANTVGAYIVLKAFPGYGDCASQPEGWHQYSPAVAADQQGNLSYSISPGFWLKGQDERLARDIDRWTQNVKDMVASGANWQLVTTFNEWGEGTVVEPGVEWASPSGYGQYLDVLHFNGNLTPPTQTAVPQSTPTNTPVTQPSSTNTTTPSASPTAPQSQTLLYSPEADAYVNASSPGSNYGGSTSLRVDGSPVVRSYLRFTVQGLSGGQVSQVRLLIYAKSSSSQGLTVQSVPDNSWNEMNVNFRDAPAPGSLLASSPGFSGGTWVTLDVTSYVTSDGTFSFEVSTPGSTAIALASREGVVNSPLLIVSLNGAATPAATITHTATSVNTDTATPVVVPTNTTVPDGDPVLVGAGDISTCSNSGDEATAKLIDGIPGTVFTAGDNAYESGTAGQFADCYDPTWGRFKDRTKPSPGNHDYNTAGASGYYAYFGAAAGDPAKGYYSYNLGAWHIVVLNSEINTSTGSAQETWLRQDLAANPATCTLAYWHKPLFSSSSSHGSSPAMKPLWQALYDYHAEVVINGHDHTYERFAPQSPDGVAVANGIREFVAGMGGRSHYSFGTILANSVARNSDTYGVLKFTLHANSYEWQFVPETGKTYADSGTGQCVP